MVRGNLNQVCVVCCATERILTTRKQRVAIFTAFSGNSPNPTGKWDASQFWPLVHEGDQKRFSQHWLLACYLGTEVEERQKWWIIKFPEMIIFKLHFADSSVEQQNFKLYLSDDEHFDIEQ